MTFVYIICSSGWFRNIDGEVMVTSDDGISCIDDTCGNVFVLVLNYNMTYDVLEMATV